MGDEHPSVCQVNVIVVETSFLMDWQVNITSQLKCYLLCSFRASFLERLQRFEEQPNHATQHHHCPAEDNHTLNAEEGRSRGG